MPKINTAYTFPITLTSQADTKLFQVNPTLAAGDFKISKDLGALTNLTNLPTVSPAGSRIVFVSLTAPEMNANVIVFQGVDAAGAEWCEYVETIETSPDDLTVAAIKVAILADNTSFNGADVAALGVDVAAVKAKTDNLPDGLKKNTAFADFEFIMRDSTDHVTGKTGLTVTAQRIIDGGAYAACTNSVTEISDGAYKIDFSAADLNGNAILFRFTATGTDPTEFTVLTAR